MYAAGNYLQKASLFSLLRMWMRSFVDVCAWSWTWVVRVLCRCDQTGGGQREVSDGVRSQSWAFEIASGAHGTCTGVCVQPRHVQNLIYIHTLHTPQTFQPFHNQWQSGYQSGQLKGQVFQDVKRNMLRWRRQGYQLMIYSSGVFVVVVVCYGLRVKSKQRKNDLSTPKGNPLIPPQYLFEKNK